MSPIRGMKHQTCLSLQLLIIRSCPRGVRYRLQRPAAGAGNTNSPLELLAIEFLARAILFDDKRCGKYGSLVRAKPLLTPEAFAPPPDASMAVM
jgi:hypothetical protein